MRYRELIVIGTLGVWVFCSPMTSALAVKPGSNSNQEYRLQIPLSGDGSGTAEYRKDTTSGRERFSLEAEDITMVAPETDGYCVSVNAGWLEARLLTVACRLGNVTDLNEDNTFGTRDLTGANTAKICKAGGQKEPWEPAIFLGTFDACVYVAGPVAHTTPCSAKLPVILSSSACPFDQQTTTPPGNDGTVAQSTSTTTSSSSGATVPDDSTSSPYATAPGNGGADDTSTSTSSTTTLSLPGATVPDDSTSSPSATAPGNAGGDDSSTSTSSTTTPSLPGATVPDDSTTTPSLPGNDDDSTSTTSAPTTSMPGQDNANASVVVTCEQRSDRSKISVNGKDLAAGSYTAHVASGGNQADAAAQTAVLGQAEFDFDSDGGDIAAGATAIPAAFIQNLVVTGQILQNGAVVAEATANCTQR